MRRKWTWLLAAVLLAGLLAGASVLLIAAPGARLLLPAVPAAQAGALAHALAEEAP